MKYTDFKNLKEFTPGTGKYVSELANIYERYRDNINSISDTTIQELHAYIEREYSKIANNVVFSACEIDCNLMDVLYVKTNEIWVSTLHNNSDLFPGEINLKWRAVHDNWHISGIDCDFWGEFQTWVTQSSGLSYSAKQVLFSEIVLQAAFCIHYGYFKDAQKVILIDIPNIEL